MLYINTKSIEGQTFYKSDPNVSYTCIGYGQSPETGSNYVVGTSWDQASNRTTISTFLLKDITFIGQLSVT